MCTKTNRSCKSVCLVKLVQSLLSVSCSLNNNTSTQQPLYNMIHNSTVLDIRRFKDGPRKCCIQSKMYGHFSLQSIYFCLDEMVIFLYKLYFFVWIQHGCLANTGLALDPSNSVIKRLWCVVFAKEKTDWRHRLIQVLVVVCCVCKREDWLKAPTDPGLHCLQETL